MKKFIAILALLVIAIFIVGCGPQPKPTQTTPVQGGQEPSQPGQNTTQGGNTGNQPPAPTFDFGQDQKDNLGSLAK